MATEPQRHRGELATEAQRYREELATEAQRHRDSLQYRKRILCVSVSLWRLRLLCVSASLWRICLLGVLCVSAAGCRQDMHDQPKYIPLRQSSFFADQRSARPLVAG